MSNVAVTAVAMWRGRLCRLAAGLPAAVVALTVAGCSGATTDPRSGGLAGGINGLASGAYEQRLEDRREALQDLDATESRLQSRVADSRARLRAVEQRLAQRKSHLRRMRAELASIDREIAAAREAVAGGNRELSDVRRSNAYKIEALSPLMEERNKLRRMTDELEEADRKEAARYAKIKGEAQKTAKADGAGAPEKDVMIAEMERSSNAMDAQAAALLKRIGTLKVRTGRLGA